MQNQLYIQIISKYWQNVKSVRGFVDIFFCNVLKTPNSSQHTHYRELTIKRIKKHYIKNAS